MISKRLWGEPKEISLLEFPVKPTSPYLALINDLALRLERTPKNRALVLDFDTADDLNRAFNSLVRLASRRLGKGHIVFVRGQRSDGTPALFVRHGSNWGRDGVERREKESQK